MISIIICTKNRASDLAGTLDSLAALPEADRPGEVEVVLVDNGSTDETPQVAQRKVGRLETRYVREERGAKAKALNTGIASSRGEILVFTDDDVRVPSTWLPALTQPLRNGDADIVAGAVHLAPHLVRPWMSNRHLAMLADTTTWQEVKLAVGANMAFRRSLLEKVPGFDVELGPGALGFCEDLLLSQQMLQAGFRLGTAFGTEATVVHHLDARRLRGQDFAGRVFKEGQCLAYIDYHWHHREIGNAAVLGLKRRLRLMQKRVTERGAEVPSWEMLNVMQDVAYYDKMRQLQGTERNYDLHGLVKKHGILEERNIATPAKTLASALK